MNEKKIPEKYSRMMYYNWNDILSYNKYLNFAKGGTRIGKTYGAKKLMMKDAIKSDGEHKFFFVKRRPADFNGGNIDNFFVRMDEFGEGWSVKKQGPGSGCFLYKGKAMGYYNAITKLKEKSHEYPNGIRWCLFDEYVLHDANMPKNSGYLDDEFEKLMQSLDAIDRGGRGMRVLFTGNNCSIYNPYDLRLGMLNTKYGITTFPNGDSVQSGSVYEFIPKLKVSERIENSPFGQMLRDTRTYRYSFHNDVLFDSNEFIRKKGYHCRPIFNIIMNNEAMGVYFDNDIRCHFVSKGECQSHLYFAATNQDHSVNTQSVEIMKQSDVYRRMVYSYENGKLFFENQKIKQNMMIVMRVAVGGRIKVE